MPDILNHIKTTIYDQSSHEVSNLKFEKESQEYAACRFDLNGFRVVSRDAKITPKKVGQFVTFWKRNKNGIIEPLSEFDPFDFYVVNVSREGDLGQFVFPKTVLIENGIVSSKGKEGKRGFRVYPTWDIVSSKQAERTQKWQLECFYQINESIDFNNVRQLYSID